MNKSKGRNSAKSPHAAKKTLTKEEILGLIAEQNDKSRKVSAPLVYTVDQVAALLQVDPKTVMRLRSQRKIAFVKIGGQLRFRLEDVESYLKRSVQAFHEDAEVPGSSKKPTDQIGLPSIVDGGEDARVALAIAAELKKRH